MKIWDEKKNSRREKMEIQDNKKLMANFAQVG